MEWVNLVQLLLDYGSDLNAKDMSIGLSPVYAAIERGIPDVLQLLIEKGGDICGSPPGVIVADTLSFNAKIGLVDF